jgi:DNA adenine methylase
MSLLFRVNKLLDGEYAEVYAGGAAVALNLLFGEYARRVHINDIDRGVYAFWEAARDHPSELTRRIRKVRLTLNEWERQRAIQTEEDPDPLELAFSTFFLNRTNRSGIVMGGVIGGRAQRGTWRIDARFNRDALVDRIERIGRWASRIEIYRLDGRAFLKDVVPSLDRRALVYLDPPYYVKGRERLYVNYYVADDHERIARLVQSLRRPWVVSYDDVPGIRKLYRGLPLRRYSIAYSAQERYEGREIVFFSPKLVVPKVANPIRVSASDVERVALQAAS